jgi:hypothetical protein
MRQAIVSYDIKCTLNDVLQIIEPEEGKWISFQRSSIVHGKTLSSRNTPRYKRDHLRSIFFSTTQVKRIDGEERNVNVS